MVCGFLLSGMFMCVFSGEINGFVSNSYDFELQFVAVNIAPLVEEIAKAIPIIFIAFLMKPSNQQLAECALAIGVGFASLENICILMGAGTISFGYAFLRAIGAGMMHGICTLVVGLAMRKVVEKEIVFFTGTLSALSVAMIYHSIYNMLISSNLMLVGVALPTATFIVIVVASVIQNKKKINQSKEKVNE